MLDIISRIRSTHRSSAPIVGLCSRVVGSKYHRYVVLPELSAGNGYISFDLAHQDCSSGTQFVSTTFRLPIPPPDFEGNPLLVEHLQKWTVPSMSVFDQRFHFESMIQFLRDWLVLQSQPPLSHTYALELLEPLELWSQDPGQAGSLFVQGTRRAISFSELGKCADILSGGLEIVQSDLQAVSPKGTQLAHFRHISLSSTKLPYLHRFFQEVFDTYSFSSSVVFKSLPHYLTSLRLSTE